MNQMEPITAAASLANDFEEQLEALLYHQLLHLMLMKEAGNHEGPSVYLTN